VSTARRIGLTAALAAPLATAALATAAVAATAATSVRASATTATTSAATATTAPGAAPATAATTRAGSATTPAARPAAFPPGRSGFYGGGAVQGFLQFVSLRVRPDGRFDAHETLVTECAPRFGDELNENIAVRNVRLSDAGRYHSTTSFTEDSPPGAPLIGGLHAEGTITYAVRVLAGGLARGIVRVRSTYSDPANGAEVSRCDTGRIPWSARRPPPDAGRGTPALQPGILRGGTGQQEPFLMKVTRRGRLVARAGMTVRATCPSAVGVPLDVVAHRVRVRRGRFGATDTFTRPFTTSDGVQVVESYSWELRGRFGRSGSRGTFELHGVVRRRSDGEAVGSCDTGTIRWRATR
jgi:hypothetical protein